MMRSHSFPGWSLGVLVVLTVLAVLPAPACAGSLGGALSFGMTQTNAPVKANGDRVDWDRQTGWVTALGNAVVQWGDETMSADRIKVNITNRLVEAEGNVVLTRPSGRWTGDRLDYQFGSDSGVVQGIEGSVGPYRLWADEYERRSKTESKLENAIVTTCTNKRHSLHFYVKADSVEVKDGESLDAKGATWYMGPVPFFYLPSWHRNLQADSGWHFRPGYDSRMGAFLLSSYRQTIFPGFRSVTRADYRTSRGVAVGEDILWRGDDFTGCLLGYYAHDLDPIDANDDPLVDSLETDRYRIGLKNEWSITEKDLLHLHADYLSDTDVLEDFFEKEHVRGGQPENFASLSHREENFTVSALAVQRLNDFYSTLNRSPEVALDVSRQALFESDIYYESRTAASVLEQTFSDYQMEYKGREPYSASRFDSGHMLYYPTRVGGFLTVMPRAGYRATYYSVTLDDLVTTNETGGFVTNRVEVEGRVRSVYETGLETSFRAFRIWPNAGTSVRHVVEPYANLTVVPEPTVEAQDLYPFDDVDKLAKARTVRFGVRNQLQGKRNEMAEDWFDLNVFADWNLLAEGDAESVPYAYLSADITPSDWFKVDVDGTYDVALGAVSKSEFRLSCDPGGWWATALEYLYRYERNRLLNAELSVRPMRGWTLTSGTRYEYETGQLEEQSAAVQHDWDCMVLRLGGRVIPGYTTSTGAEVPDEWRVMIEFWFTAFPEFGISGRSGLQ